MLTCTSTGNTEILKGRSGSVSVGSLGPGAHMVMFKLSKHLWKVWSLILNVISPALQSCRGFSFALGCGVSFFLLGSNTLLLLVVQQQVAIGDFLQEKMSTCLSALLSCSFFALISHASKVMLKILQMRLQQYTNQELPDI